MLWVFNSAAGRIVQSIISEYKNTALQAKHLVCSKETQRHTTRCQTWKGKNHVSIKRGEQTGLRKKSAFSLVGGEWRKHMTWTTLS